MRIVLIILAVFLIIGSALAWGLGLFGGEGFFSTPSLLPTETDLGLSLGSVKMPKALKDIWGYLSGDLFPILKLLKTPRPKLTMDMVIKSLFQGLVAAGLWRITRLLAPLFGIKNLVEDTKQVPKGVAGWLSSQVERLVGQSPLRKRFFWIAVAELGMLIAYFLIPEGKSKNLLGEVGLFIPLGVGAIIILVYITGLAANFIQKILLAIATTVGLAMDIMGDLAKLVLVVICALPIIPMAVPEILPELGIKTIISGMPDLARLGLAAFLIIVSASLISQLGLEEVGRIKRSHRSKK